MMAAAHACICLILFFLGASLASYLMCVGERLAREEKVIRKNSCCPHCGHVLEIRDLVPVISFLVRKGRCRYCHGKIPVRHLATEILMGTAFSLLYLEYRFSPGFFLGMVLLVFTFTAAVEDQEAKTVHNRLVLIPAVLLAGEVLILAEETRLQQILYIAACAVLYLIAAILITVLEKKLLHKEILGGADIKVLFLCIGFLGPSGSIRMLAALLILLAAAMIIAGIKKTIQRPRAMVPYIAAAAAIAYLTPFLTIMEA